MRATESAFNTRLNTCLKVAQDAHRTSAVGTYLLPLDERELIVNGAFLQMFVAFEEFLEGAFLHYSVGRMSTARWRAVRYARPQNADHANKILLGTARYVDWSTPDTVRKFAANMFQNGEPFESALAARHQHLLDMKTARNASAHQSRSTQSALEGLYARWTGHPRPGVTVYEMLTASQVSTQTPFYSISASVIASAVTDIAGYN